MSLRRGSEKKQGPPAHQNKFAFKHNKGSAKTEKILAIPNHGVCRHCRDVIEWRKKFRKYKPLKAPAKCNSCSQKTVMFAYHALCTDCARKLDVCPKCCKKEQIIEEVGDQADLEATIAQLESGPVPGIRERERRSLLRKLLKEADGGEKVDTADPGELVETDSEGEAGEDFEDEDDDEASRPAKPTKATAATTTDTDSKTEPTTSSHTPAGGDAPAADEEDDEGEEEEDDDDEEGDEEVDDDDEDEEEEQQ